MNEITLTVNLSGEDRKRLDAILDALEASRNCERCANTVANAFSDFAGGPGTALKQAEPRRLKPRKSRNSPSRQPKRSLRKLSQ